MDLAAAVAPTTLARQRTLPVADPLAPLLPDGALAGGRAVSCGGIAATSLALALAAEATAAGAWLAVVDVPWLGVEAAAELGVPLERLVRVDPGRRQPAVAGVGRPRGCRPRRLRARRHPGPRRLDAGTLRRVQAGAGQGGRADRRRRPGPAVRRRRDGRRPRCGRASSTAGATCAAGGSPSRRPAGASPARAGPSCGSPGPDGTVAAAEPSRVAVLPLRWGDRDAGWSRCGAPTGRSSPPGWPPGCRPSCSTPTGSSPARRLPRPRAWRSASAGARPSSVVPTSCCSTTTPTVTPGRSSRSCAPSAASPPASRWSSRGGCASAPAARRATSAATSAWPSRSSPPSRGEAATDVGVGIADGRFAAAVAARRAGRRPVVVPPGDVGGVPRPAAGRLAARGRRGRRRAGRAVRPAGPGPPRRPRRAAGGRRPGPVRPARAPRPPPGRRARRPPRRRRRAAARAPGRADLRRSRRPARAARVRRQAPRRRARRRARRRGAGVHPPRRHRRDRARRAQRAGLVPGCGDVGAGDGRAGALAARRLDVVGRAVGRGRAAAAGARRGARRRRRPAAAVGRPVGGRRAGGARRRPAGRAGRRPCGPGAGVAGRAASRRPLRLGAGVDHRSHRCRRHRRAAAAARSTGPWPGSLPAPSPAVVLPEAQPAELLDADGRPVGSAAGASSARRRPRWRSAGATPEAVTGWAGPWPLDERWWEPGRHRRLARFQVVTADGAAHLVLAEHRRWWVAAAYG